MSLLHALHKGGHHPGGVRCQRQHVFAGLRALALAIPQTKRCGVLVEVSYLGAQQLGHALSTRIQRQQQSHVGKLRAGLVPDAQQVPDVGAQFASG